MKLYEKSNSVLEAGNRFKDNANLKSLMSRGHFIDIGG